MSSKPRRVTPIVLREVTGWRALNCKFVSLGIEVERAIAVGMGFRIIPKSDDDYKKIIRLFKEEKVPHHTFPLPSKRNIHAVIRGIPASFSEQVIREELEQKGYSPHHIIRLKRSSGVPIPLAYIHIGNVAAIYTDEI
nr:unnamed protein product [Callosobruchus chinensis]